MCAWHKESILDPVVVLFPLPLLFVCLLVSVLLDGALFLVLSLT